MLKEIYIQNLAVIREGVLTTVSWLSLIANSCVVPRYRGSVISRLPVTIEEVAATTTATALRVMKKAQ